MDLICTTGSLVGAFLVSVIFYTKEEGYPLETCADEGCFFSSEITDGLVSRRFARSYKHFTIPRLTD